MDSCGGLQSWKRWATEDWRPPFASQRRWRYRWGDQLQAFRWRRRWRLPLRTASPLVARLRPAVHGRAAWRVGLRRPSARWIAGRRSRPCLLRLLRALLLALARSAYLLLAPLQRPTLVSPLPTPPPASDRAPLLSLAPRLGRTVTPAWSSPMTVSLAVWMSAPALSGLNLSSLAAQEPPVQAPASVLVQVTEPRPSQPPLSNE